MYIPRVTWLCIVYNMHIYTEYTGFCPSFLSVWAAAGFYEGYQAGSPSKYQHGLIQASHVIDR